MPFGDKRVAVIGHKDAQFLLINYYLLIFSYITKDVRPGQQDGGDAKGGLAL